MRVDGRRVGFKAIDTANQLIHYQEALVGEALKSLEQQGVKRNSCFFRPSLLQPAAKTIGRLTIPAPISPPRLSSPLPAH